MLIIILLNWYGWCNQRSGLKLIRSCLNCLLLRLLFLIFVFPLSLYEISLVGRVGLLRNYITLAKLLLLRICLIVWSLRKLWLFLGGCQSVAQILCFMEGTKDFLFSALSVIPLDLEDERRRFKCILGFTFNPRPLLCCRPCV